MSLFKALNFSTFTLISILTLSATAAQVSSCPAGTEVTVSCQAKQSSYITLKVTGAHVCEGERGSFLIVHWQGNSNGPANPVNVIPTASDTVYNNYKLNQVAQTLTVKNSTMKTMIPAAYAILLSDETVPMTCDRY